jgi:hypothetical protein
MQKGDLMKTQLVTLTVAALLNIIVVVLTRADSVNINNAGFETPTLADGNYVYTDAGNPTLSGGWTNNVGTDHNAGILNPSSGMCVGGNAPEGTNVLYVYSSTGSGNTASSVVAQVLSTNLQVAVYTLTVKVGDRLDTANNGYAVRLGYGASMGSFTLLAEDNNTLTLPNGGWVTSTVTYTNRTAIAQPLQIQLIAKNGNGTQVIFDDVSITATLLPRGTLIWIE